MAVKKTKKLSGQQLTTTVASGETFLKVDANGKVTRIDLPHLQSELLGGVNLDCMLDNVFIMYHAKDDNYPRMVKPHLWGALQSSGEVADGVVIVEGGKVLVVAPTEADSAGLPWSSAAVSGGASTTNDRLTLLNDWAGKANTAAIIAASTSTAITNTNAYAPGFCNLYSRVNANGKGLTAGKWWLPSIGELMMMSANKTKINYALSLINGATCLREVWYWSSTKSSANQSWYVHFNSGYLGTGLVSDTKKGVRPVSAFIS